MSIKTNICNPRHLAELYLQFGSVEEALAQNPDLPISTPDFHRKVKDYGIIKYTGRQKVSLAEVLYFFAKKVCEPDIPIEKLYQLMPWAIKESASIATIYRIYKKICQKLVRSYAAALVITGPDPKKILLADEEKQNLPTGKILGSTSIPMGFAVKGECFSDSILRVLQREFSVKLTLKKELTKQSALTKRIIKKDITPFMYLHLLDVEVAVFFLKLPQNIFENLEEIASSYKLKNHRFMSIEDLSVNKNIRPGVREIVEGYKNYKFRFSSPVPIVKNSSINEEILAFVS